MAWADPGSDAARHWAAEAVTWQIDLVAHLTPTLSRNIDLNRVWKRALREADAKLAEFQQETARALLKLAGREAECPVPLEIFCSEDFDFRELVARRGFYEGGGALSFVGRYFPPKLAASPRGTGRHES
jgi:hypothetical protein